MRNNKRLRIISYSPIIVEPERYLPSFRNRSKKRNRFYKAEYMEQENESTNAEQK